MNASRIFRHRIHGYEVESELELSAPEGIPSAPPDLRIEVGRVPFSTRQERGAAIGGIATPFGSYEICRHPEGFWLQFADACDFLVGSSRVTAIRTHGIPTELVSLLAGGSALALSLIARGDLVLHASAVASKRGAIAIVGSSSMGKSTLAALLCASGWHLVTDDVLRVAVGAREAIAYAGGNEVRLRPGASNVQTLLPSWQARRSIDGRVALHDPSANGTNTWPLRALVVPDDSFQARFSLRRLSGAAAVVELLRHPRILGWRDPLVLELLTRGLSAVARAVPVYRLTMRTGPPFDATFARELADVIEDA